jgi:hypothetical protein
MGLWYVETPTSSRQSADRWQWGQLYAPAALYPQEDSWYSFLLDSESISILILRSINLKSVELFTISNLKHGSLNVHIKRKAKYRLYLDAMLHLQSQIVFCSSQVLYFQNSFSIQNFWKKGTLVSQQRRNVSQSRQLNIINGTKLKDKNMTKTFVPRF